MAARGSAARTVQRKIQKIYNELLNNPKLQEILKETTEESTISFILEDCKSASLGDNVDLFSSNIEQGLKSLSRVRGRKQDCMEILRHFHEQMMENFPELAEAGIDGELPPRKKAKNDLGEDFVEKRGKASGSKGVSEDLNTKNKGLIRDIISKLTKNHLCEPFLYPVDKSLYPEYYDLISSPMDFATLKKKMNEYNSIVDVFDDIRLIWRNCLLYNIEGSDIAQAALQLGKECESLIQENFGTNLCNFDWTKAKAGKKTKANIKDDEREHNIFLSNSAMKEILRIVSEDKKSIPFQAPVDPLDAPDYHQIITSPMDLSTVNENFRKGVYDDHCEKFIQDMRLIWSNCMEYNEPDSDIVEAAEDLKARFERLVHDCASRKKEKDPLEAKSPAPHSKKSTDVATKSEKSVDPEQSHGEIILDLIKTLKSNEFIAPFLHPVSAKDAPGYYDVVSHPMDISTVEKKLKNGEYLNQFDNFLADIRLIWSNCKLYNDPQSDIYGWAETCENAFEDKLKKSLKKLKRKHPGVEIQDTSREKVSSTNSNEMETSVDLGEDDMDIDDDIPGSSSLDEKKKRRIYASHRVRMFKSVLKTLYDNEICEKFKFPATDPKYLKKVEKPIDLSIIKAKIEDYHNFPLTFLADVKLVFDNYVLVYPSDHELHQQATLLKQIAVDSFFKCFPSLHKNPGDQKFAPRVDMEIEDHYSVVKPLQKVTGANSNPSISKSSSDAIRASNIDPYKLFNDLPSATKSDRTSIPELESTLKQLVEEVDANKIHCIRKMCQKKATMLLKDVRLPWIVIPELYEVHDLGKLSPSTGCNSANGLFPIGYKCSHNVRLCLIPEGESMENMQSIVPYVPVTVHSKIEMEGSNMSFKITLENGTLLTEASDPRSAWLSLISKESKTLNCVGSKLRRCRAVLNRLCVSKDAEPFLEQVPMDDKFASDYYSVITSPMWLREVHSRLSDGTYDNEFDFAWDVRLIFRNCRQYNVKGSSLFKAADKLSLLFDKLFINWVYNVQDKSVDDAAKGEWDDWYHLKYFDSIDPAENICVLTGEKLEESKLVQCGWCDDQYSFVAVGLSRKAKSGWVCPRCQKALEMAGNGNLNDDPFGKHSETSTYSCANFGRHVFCPALDVGEGWYQAKKKNGAGLKNLFLSPLGYEVTKDSIPAQTEFEITVDNELMAARGKEFKEISSSGKTGSRASSRKKGRKSKASASAIQSENSSAPLDSKFLEEDGRIYNGKLYNFAIPENYRIAWFVISNESEIIEAMQNQLDGITSLIIRKEMESEDIPELGYYGLHVKEIRSVLEGLENSVDCEVYNFLDAEKYRSSLIEEYTTKLQQGAVSEEAQEALKKALLKARWNWEHEKLFPRYTRKDQSITGSIKTGFQPISTHNLPNGGMDILLSVWDFLESSQTVLGYTNVTLTELMSSVFPPLSILPTCGQVIFDEICSLFSDMLFREIQTKYSCWSTIEWQNVLFVNPINTITWPKVCERALLILSLPWTKSEAKTLMNSVLYGEPLIQMKILCLLYNHPLMDKYLGYEPLERIKTLILSSCYENSAKLTITQFCSDLCDVLVKLEEESMEAVDKARSAQLLIWLKSLFCRIGYMSVSLEDPLSAQDLQDLMWCDRRDFGSYTIRNNGNQCEEVLTPSAFSTEMETLFSVKMRYLLALERTLSLLSSVDTEGLCVQDRISIYITLVDHCCATHKYLQIVQTLHSGHVGKLESLPIDEYEEIMSQNRLESPKTVPANAVCHFTGVPFKFLPSPSKWARVPQDLLEFTELKHSNIVEATIEDKCDEAGSVNHSDAYALKDVLNRLINCKKLSIRDRGLYESSIENRLKLIYSQDNDYRSSVFLRSKPIGYDEMGTSYWLMDAQSSMTLFSFDSAGKSKDPANGRTHEPCILARDLSGTWYYYPELDVTQLFSTFGETESTLRLRMIERYGMIRTALKNSTLCIRTQQQLWVDRKLSAESWVSEAMLYTGQNEAHRCRQLEVLWARCAEVRMNIYYAHFHFFEDDRERTSQRAEREALLKRQRNMKENMVEDTFDCHPTKGWSRLDEFAHIRQLGATTTACRIHSDPTLATSIQSNLRSCGYLKIKGESGSTVAMPTDPVVVNPPETMDNVEEVRESFPPEESEIPLHNNPAHTGSRTKPIEQLHIVTGEVLRVYPSGKDAAAFMNVSQSSISQCLQGKRSDCFGFRWRFYEGPPIDFDAIKDSQTPLSELRTMQLARNKPVEPCEEKLVVKKPKANQPEEDEGIEKSGNSAAVGPSQPKNENFCFPSAVQPKLQHHIITSSKTVPAKLVKLKGELLNILFCFPEKALKWTELDAASESMIQATGEAAANNVIQSFNGRQDPNVDVDRLAEKASRKARRRLRRKLAMDIFLKCVQMASTPSELLTQVTVLEDAIPQALTFEHITSSLPINASTTSELALRIFVLDRSIAYHEIQGLENASACASFKLRFHLSPRCHANGVCQRFLGHTGKCMSGPPSFSRLPDHFQLAPPQDSFCQPSSNSRELSHNSMPVIDRRPPQNSLLKTPQKPAVDILPKLSSFLEKEGLDIENIQPYIPSFQEVTQAQWL